jgi:dephospho-CoA kinase
MFIRDGRLIGLTGLYCAGKNHVASLLEMQGLAVLDVDKLGHIAIENKKKEIFARFGENLANSDGSVNRRLLGANVFGNKNEMADLEAIVHPEANRLTTEWIALQNGNPCVINAALLHRSSVFQQLGCIIIVTAPLFIRLLRAKKRDNLPWPAIAKRIASQRHFFVHYTPETADIYKVVNPGFGEGWLADNNAARLDKNINIIMSKLGLNSRIV